MALRFNRDDFVKIIGISGNYRYGFIQETSEGADHLIICLHEEGSSRLAYEEASQKLLGFGAPHYTFSDTEKRLLPLLAQQKKIPAIAAQLELSPSTIRGHIRVLRLKLQLDNRVQLQVMAAGLVKMFKQSS